jgi:LAS superfamily LD-carboxypeptidase LdcB
MKKLLSLLFASVVVFSLTMPAFANGKGTDSTTKTTKTHKTKATKNHKSHKTSKTAPAKTN